MEPHTDISDAQRTVLIVEDNADDRATYRRYLDSEFRTLEAANMRDGLDLALSSGADCILLDQVLPDGDGLRFIESFRDRMPQGGPAIVMVTGQGSEEMAASAMRSGAYDYLTKDGLTKGSMMRAINNAVDRRELQRESSRAHGQLEKSFRALSEFAHTASHDLKAPVRHIISYCEMLRDDYAPQLDATGQKYINRLIVNSRRMQQLVDDLLAYSEARENAEEKENFDLNIAVREAREFLEEVIDETGARIEYDTLPAVKAYPLRAKRLMLNLISNALKYRSAAPPIIRISCADQGGEYRCAVSDNGLGIEPEFIEQIFEPFKRLHSRDAVEGSGLGLSICREIMEMHGGKIWVESTPGAGSAFYFTFPKD